MQLFLRWLLSVVLFALGYVVLSLLNVTRFMVESGMIGYGICLTILIMTALASLRCGYLTWCASMPYSSEFPSLQNKANIGWFVSWLCQAIGMVGTVVGLIMMLGSFQTFRVNNADSAQKLLAEIGLGMSVAFITTLVGLVCSIILSVQYFNLTNFLDKQLGGGHAKPEV